MASPGGGTDPRLLERTASGLNALVKSASAGFWARLEFGDRQGDRHASAIRAQIGCEGTTSRAVAPAPVA